MWWSSIDEDFATAIVSFMQHGLRDLDCLIRRDDAMRSAMFLLEFCCRLDHGQHLCRLWAQSDRRGCSHACRLLIFDGWFDCRRLLCDRAIFYSPSAIAEQPYTEHLPQNDFLKKIPSICRALSHTFLCVWEVSSVRKKMIGLV